MHLPCIVLEHLLHSLGHAKISCKIFCRYVSGIKVYVTLRACQGFPFKCMTEVKQTLK